MILSNKIYTMESVLKGHPDKICDQISDGLLDLFLSNDKNARTAIECLGTRDKIIIAGEVKSIYNVPVEKYCRELYKSITGFPKIEILNLLTLQSEQLSIPVEKGCAGDQGIMYGYACYNEYNCLPYGYWLANFIAKRLDKYKEESKLFLSDGKVQVTVSDDIISKLTINVQHFENTDLEMLRKMIKSNVLYDIEAQKVVINEDTGFIHGGFSNDTGLTGRKIIIDTYGGLVPHGGGAFSGKDPTKVDRSAAYMCRYVAKNLVMNGLAKECIVSVAYDFGQATPSMINVTTDRENSNKLTEFISKKFDFRPQAIIECLKLKEVSYLKTATYGHFTNECYPWEKIISL